MQKSEGLVLEMQGRTCAIDQSCGDKLPVRGQPDFQGWDVPLAKNLCDSFALLSEMLCSLSLTTVLNRK